jgi:site-specific DNA-methyltransferase (adenine-specific)
MQIELYNADCLDVLPNISDGSIDLILADNPYEKTQNRWDSVIPLKELFSHYRRIISDNGAIVLFGDEPFTSMLIMEGLDIYKYKWTWKKGNKPTGFLNAKKQPLRITEDIVVFYKNQPIYNPQMIKGNKVHSRGKIVGTELGRSLNYGEYNAVNTEGDMKYPQTLLEFPRDTKRFHPTQKPVALLEYLIRTYTNEQMTVLDNAMGSGSTIVAAKNLNRKAMGIEKDTKLGYFKIAKERIDKTAISLPP